MSKKVTYLMVVLIMCTLNVYLFKSISAFARVLPWVFISQHYHVSNGPIVIKNQDPVVQSIVSLTISLRHKFVKQISAKVTNTLLFFVEKNVRILCTAKDSHIFFNKK